MDGKFDKTQRFVVLAEIYSRLTRKSGNEMTGEEMEGFYYALVTRCSSPDEFYKLVEHKIIIEEEDDASE